VYTDTTTSGWEDDLRKAFSIHGNFVVASGDYELAPVYSSVDKKSTSVIILHVHTGY